MRRHSIAWLMIVILVLAVGIAALRNASDLWAGAMLLTTLGLLTIAIVGATYRRGPDRAWWYGFALFGWGYLTLSMGPWFADQIGLKLPTTQGLAYVHAIVVEQPQHVAVSGNVRLSQFGGTQVSGDQIVLSFADGSVTKYQASAGQTSPRFARLARSAFPGAINFDAFLRVGHSLLALIVALLGAEIARWFQKSQAPATT